MSLSEITYKDRLITLADIPSNCIKTQEEADKYRDMRFFASKVSEQLEKIDTMDKTLETMKGNVSQSTYETYENQINEELRIACAYGEMVRSLLDSPELLAVYDRATYNQSPYAYVPNDVSYHAPQTTPSQPKQSDPTPPKQKKTPIWKILLILVPVLLLFFMFFESIAYVATEPASTPKPSYKPVSYTNGQMLESPSDERVCPLSISVSGNNGYYVYLKNVSKSSNDIAFLIKPNSTVEIDVPIGQYELFYATGETWCGKAHLFGADTRYYTTESYLKFYADSQYYHGHTLELWEQAGGNMEEIAIDESDFPG